MIASIESARQAALKELESAGDPASLEAFRVKYLSRKGIVAQFFDALKQAPPADKPALGKAVNDLRAVLQSAFDGRSRSALRQEPPLRRADDLTLPGREPWIGRKHPITATLEEIERIFIGMGFVIEEGPEIEDDYHNFGALNFPPDHPARDMQDTFFINDTMLLRTHTTPVQVRIMERSKPPIRAIMPGRAYRNEAISARSYCLFHQVDGIYVDRGVTFTELKGTLVAFARQLYGTGIPYRFRPSFFPFTEPSAEMDVRCVICGGTGCRLCKHSGWLEILGR